MCLSFKKCTCTYRYNRNYLYFCAKKEQIKKKKYEHATYNILDIKYAKQDITILKTFGTAW